MKPLVFSLLKKLICFLLSKSIGQSIDYQIVTSNERIKDHEKLFYQLTVIKDQFPIISASYGQFKVDKSFVLGQISDDYGFSKLQIVYYPKGKLEFVKRGVIPIRIDGYDQFYFLFR
jgi:hypothetical protein